MPNYFNAPEIQPADLAQKMQRQEPLILLDVREKWELAYAGLRDERIVPVPLSQLAQRGLPALPAPARDRESEIVVICHHGVRSAEVTAWLLQEGWKNVRSLAGGLDAYAAQVDPSIGQY
jgi:rhodanese-related sulfurtransferase